MIADFLEANKIEGRLFSFPNSTSLAKACLEVKVSADSGAYAHVFVNASMDFFVVIALASEKVDYTTAQELFARADVEEVNDTEVSPMTGFEKKYFPPVGVFGTEVVLTSAAQKKSSLVFALSQTEFLLIAPKEIIRASEIGKE